MKNLVTTQKTMSSREIAEQTGKNHADVCRDIRMMLDGLDIGESIFASSYLTAQNKEVKQYLLPQREAMILASGYNVKVRAWFVDYFFESQKPKTALELIANALTQVQIETNERLTAVEHKVDSLQINKTVLPKSGYASTNELATTLHFSNNMIKLFIDKVNPKSTQAMKQLPDGSVKPYTAYKIKPIKKFANKVRNSARPINAKEVYFRSPLLGTKNFKLGV